LRSLFEAKLGRDFSDVRIHRDASAANAARSLGAQAFTVGRDVVFGEGRYAPGSSSGSRLLAHELAHVVQQESSPGAPRLQRKEDPDHAEEVARSRANAATPEIDVVSLANVIGPEGLIDYARKLHSSGGGKATSPRERATILLKIYRKLEQMARTAERRDGVLMRPRTGSFELLPWQPGAKQVSEIDPFRPANVQHWIGQVGFDPPAAEPHEEEAPRSSSRTPRQEAPKNPPPALPEAKVGALLKQQPDVASEKYNQVMDRVSHLLGAGKMLDITRKGGADEINAGLEALDHTTVGAVEAAMAQRLGEVAGDQYRGAIVHPSPIGKTTLRRTVRKLIYVANRAYLLDANGHLIPSEISSTDVSQSLGAGTFFFSEFKWGVPGSGSTSSGRALLRVDGGVRIVPGHLYLGSARDTLDMINLVAGELSEGAGVATIVSRDAHKHNLVVYNERQVWDALTRIPRHVPWAIAAEVKEVYEHWDDLIVNQIVGEGIGKLAKEVPEVGQILQLAERLKKVAWLAQTLSIAAYGNADEIDICAQTFARTIAGWLVSQIINAAVSMAKAGATSAIARLRKKAGGSSTGAAPKVTSKKSLGDKAPPEKASPDLASPPPLHETAPEKSSAAPAPKKIDAAKPAIEPKPETHPEQLRRRWLAYQKSGGKLSMKEWHRDELDPKYKFEKSPTSGYGDHDTRAQAIHAAAAEPKVVAPPHPPTGEEKVITTPQPPPGEKLAAPHPPIGEGAKVEDPHAPAKQQPRLPSAYTRYGISRASLDMIERVWGRAIRLELEDAADADDIAGIIERHKLPTKFQSDVTEARSQSMRNRSGRLTVGSDANSTEPGVDQWSLGQRGGRVIIAPVEVKSGFGESPHYVGAKKMPKAFHDPEKLNAAFEKMLRNTDIPLRTRVQFKRARAEGAVFEWEIDTHGDVRLKIKGKDAFPKTVRLEIHDE
jgi:hypothetical protein